MQNLLFKTLDPKYIDLYESWFDQRAASYQLFKDSKHQNLSIQNTSAWTGSIESEVVAIAIFFTDSTNQGHLDLAVKPSERRQGIAEELLSLVLEEPPVKIPRSIQVNVEPENTAGQKILRKFGFAETGRSEDDLVEYKKQK